MHRAVRGALLSIALATPFQYALATDAIGTGTGSSTQARRHFDIAAGPLGDALNRFASAAGITVQMDARLVDGRRSNSINGNYTIAEGFAALLGNAGLRAIEGAPNTYVLQPGATTAIGAGADAAAQTLPVISVNAAGERENPLGPANGYVATRSRTGTKTDTLLKETPQSVSVVTREQLDAQGVESIAESLRYTPGVVTQYGNTDLRYDWLTVRGFVPGRYLDGLRLPFGSRGYSQPRIEPYGLERVEVLKGPTSLLYGQGTPGGLVNMVSKRPTTDTVREVELQYGSHNRKQLALDLGGKLDETGELSYRLVGLTRRSDTAYDYVNEEKTYIAPSITWRPNTDTHLTLMAQYQKLSSQGGGGAPVLPANGTLYTSVYKALPLGTFAGEPNFDHYSNEQYFLGYEFEHRLNDTWTLRQNLRYGETMSDTKRVQLFCLTTACNPTSMGRYAWAFPEKSKLFTVDNQAQATFSTGPVKQTVLMGVDYSSERSVYDESALSPLATAFNVYAPVYGTYNGAIPAVATHIEQNREQLGAYLQDQIKLDRWTLVAGGRYDWADTTTRTVTSTANNNVKQSDGAFTGRFGLLYSFDNGITPYVSYSTSFQPAVGTSRTLQPFQPTKGKQYETGIKYQPDGSSTMVTLSAYELTQQNVTTPDPINTNFSVQTGEVRMRGIELEGKLNLQKGLDLIASYGYTDSKITKANASGAGVNTTGNRLAFVPRNQASAWLDYTVQNEALAGLGMGVGARHIGENYGDNANVYHMPGVTLFDAALRFDFGKVNPQLKGLRMALNASNILNKTYVAACLSSAGCYYGDGRNVYLTLKYGW